MILLHRITPFVAGLFTLLGFVAITTSAFHPLLSLILSWLIVTLLLARLCGWQWRSLIFWNLVGVPSLFVALSGGLFLFLESDMARWVVTAVVPILVLLFGEHVFTYLHTPATYQAYAIEHLSRAINILNMFCLGVIAFGLRIFLQAPFIILVPAIFLLSYILIHGTLWASKIEASQATPYGRMGALILTELFVVIALLPTGIYVNAAWLAVGLYVVLGLSRAHILGMLSRSVSIRYLVAAAACVLGIAGTASWR